MSLQVPNNARSIEGRRHCLFVLAYSDVANSSSVFFKGSFHDLSLRANLPDPHFSFHTSRDDSLAVVGKSESGYSMVVSVVDHVEELA